MSTAFVVYGKGEDLAYSVRTADGQAVCTCAYNPGSVEERAAMAQLIAAALNKALPAGLPKVRSEAKQPPTVPVQEPPVCTF